MAVPARDGGDGSAPGPSQHDAMPLGDAAWRREQRQAREQPVAVNSQGGRASSRLRQRAEAAAGTLAAGGGHAGAGGGLAPSGAAAGGGAGGVDDRPLKERLEDYMSREWQRIAVRIRRSDLSPDEVEDAALTLGCEASAVRTGWANALKRQGKSGTLDNVPARSLAAKQNARAAVAAEQAEAKAALAALPPPDWRAVFAVRCLSGDNPGRAHAWAELQAAGLNGALRCAQRAASHALNEEAHARPPAPQACWSG